MKDSALDKSNLIKVNEKLISLLSEETGLFGKIYSWGYGTNEKYVNVGVELSDDFYPVLENMDINQYSNFFKIITYFEIHASPLSKLFHINEKDFLDEFYSKIAWSHFITLILFGMIEIACKRVYPDEVDTRGNLKEKGNNIKKFLNQYLADELKLDITKRYKVDDTFSEGVNIEKFDDVINHLWSSIRCGFVHDATIESKSLESYSMSGLGSKEDPIRLATDVAVHEWIKIIWEAILKSHGYLGTLEYCKIKYNKMGSARDNIETKPEE